MFVIAWLTLLSKHQHCRDMGTMLALHAHFVLLLKALICYAICACQKLTQIKP